RSVAGRLTVSLVVGYGRSLFEAAAVVSFSGHAQGLR
ncbi:MAG: hypothetical protein ACI85K_000049, partial [Hyphomicrobiaceae bacterium]